MPGITAGTAAIMAGATVGASALNGISTSVRNKRAAKYTKQINEQLYQYQRERDAIANQYNIDMFDRSNAYNEYMWNKQNEYNSPLAQMERYKDAGLNPNLIYNQQNTASGAPSASPISADFSSAPNYHVPDVQAMNFDSLQQLGNVLMSYQDLRSKRLDNDLKEQTFNDALARSYNDAYSSRYSSDIRYYESLNTLKSLVDKYGLDATIPLSISDSAYHSKDSNIILHSKDYNKFTKSDVDDWYKKTFDSANTASFSLSNYLRENYETNLARNKANLAGDKFLSEVYKAKQNILHRLIERDKDGNVKFKTLIDPSLHNELKTLQMIIDNSSLYDSGSQILGILGKFLLKKK